MNILEFAQTVGKLKRTKRTGWEIFNVPGGESVAEHSFRVAVLALFLGPQFGVDTDRAVRMALIHDLGEAEIGDIVTHRGGEILPNLQDKLTAERNALVNILNSIDSEGDMELYDEFEAQRTKESRFIKDLDKLEAAIQAYEYEQEHPIDLSEFIAHAKAFVKHPKLKEVLKDIENLREKK